MKTLSIAILLFLTQYLFAQNDINLSADSDTAFWYDYKNGYAKQFHLGLIESDTAEYSFRFWSNGLTIKVYKSHHKTFGDITRFVEEYPSTRKKRIFKKQYDISPFDADKIINLIDSLEIRTMPSDKHIKGWQQGVDGITYFVEYKQNNQYSFKHYWTPSSQDSLPEAVRLLNFISAVEDVLHLKDSYNSFGADIPFNGWSYPGSMQVVTRTKHKRNKQ